MLYKAILKSLLVAPAVLGATIALSTSVIAQEAAQSELAQLNEYAAEGEDDSLSQVTSVSQLSDVQPTDWAFQALQNLIARYGCIAGYPDGTYRGFTALSRYEFAAGLNACLNNITANLDQIQLNQQDIATLNRLQQQFAADLATLRGRVDSLEARTAELEANQFSTTTKLNGEVIFAQQFAIDDDRDLDGFDDGQTPDENEATFAYRVRLNFDTSFTGEDRLRTRFQARNLDQFDSDPIGRSFGNEGDGGFSLDDLVYTFPLGPAEVVVGANSIASDDFVASTISPLDSASSGTITDFGFPRQYAIAVPGNAGAGAVVQLNDNFSLDFGYSAADASNPDDGFGLFNGTYGAIGQITFLSSFFDAAITYANSYANDGFGYTFPAGQNFGGPMNLTPIDASSTGNDEVANTYGTQFNFRLFDGALELGGGGAFVQVNGIGAAEDYEIWTYQGTLAINDVLGEGNQLGVVAGVPEYSRDLNASTGDTGFLTEVFYRYQLNDNIAITPGFLWINDPYNNNDNDDSFVGNIRTTFQF